MRYCISDLHGKYELFQKLLNVIHFSEQDTMYICGDIIDKGESSIRLAKYISSFPNMHSVMGGTIGWWVFKNIEEITHKTEENKNVTCDGQRRI